MEELGTFKWSGHSVLMAKNNAE
jgi:putative transposase